MQNTILWRRFLGWFRRDTVRLWLVWFLGLTMGTICARYADPTYYAMMRLAASGRMSIVGLAASVLLPFLISAYAVLIDKPGLLLGVCTCKAFSFGYSGTLARGAFGTAGWLIQPLLQFTQICMIPVLCCFCLRHISGRRSSVKRELAICLVLMAICAGIDYFVVSPFLAKLIDYSLGRYT